MEKLVIGVLNLSTEFGINPTQEEIQQQIKELPKIRPEVEHKKLSDILRDAIGKFVQGFGSMYNPQDKKFCAVGVLAFDSGMSRDDIVSKGSEVLRLHPELNDSLIYNGVEKQVYMWITSLNDNGRSFEQIADFLEKNGY